MMKYFITIMALSIFSANVFALNDQIERFTFAEHEYVQANGKSVTAAVQILAVNKVLSKAQVTFTETFGSCESHRMIHVRDFDIRAGGFLPDGLLVRIMESAPQKDMFDKGTSGRWKKVTTTELCRESEPAMFQKSYDAYISYDQMMIEMESAFRNQWRGRRSLRPSVCPISVTDDWDAFCIER